MSDPHQVISVGVLGLPVNTQGQFLLTRRVDRFPQRNHKWQVAGGGMEWGEQPEDTLEREFLEELGVKPEIICPVPVVLTQNWHIGDHTSQVVLISYIVTIDETKIKLNHEASAYGWFEEQTLDPDQALPATPIIINRSRKLLDKWR